MTSLLRAWRGGDEDALAELMPLIYGELRRLAGEHMRHERSAHTLSPTDLVSEAFMRLIGHEGEWADQVHFFAVAARHMRHILVDHARKRAAEKRGAGARRITFDEQLLADARPDELVALDEALDALAQHDERKARAVELHYFGGLTHKDVARVLDVHENTVLRDLRLAEAWLAKALNG